MVLKDPIRRGQLASEILTNDLWPEAFEMLTKAYMVEALKCGIKDDLPRFRILEAIRQVETVRSHLEAVLLNGQLAAEQARAFEEPRPLLRRVF